MWQTNSLTWFVQIEIYRFDWVYHVNLGGQTNTCCIRSENLRCRLTALFFPRQSLTFFPLTFEQFLSNQKACIEPTLGNRWVLLTLGHQYADRGRPLSQATCDECVLQMNATNRFGTRDAPYCPWGVKTWYWLPPSEKSANKCQREKDTTNWPKLWSSHETPEKRCFE